VANRQRTRGEPGHESVLGNLLDLQARLRGEPASALPAARTLILDDGTVAVADDVVVIPDFDPAARLDALDVRIGRLEELLHEVIARLPRD